MRDSKNKTLKRFIALAINLQFIFPSAVFAEMTTGEKVMTGLGMANQLTGAYFQQSQQLQMQQASERQKQYLAQQFSLKPMDPTQVPALFSQAGCVVFDAKNDKPGDMCEPNSYDPQKAQSGYYSAMKELARNNSNDLENLLTNGHERFTSQGMGCLYKAVNQFDQQLKSRVEALRKLEQDMEEQVKAFEKLAEKDKEDIKKGQALLTGKPEKYLRDVKFEKQFADPQCRSLLGRDSLRAEGAKGGFTAIQEILEQRISPAAGPSPKELKDKTRDIKKEIRRIADQAMKVAEDNDSLEVNPGEIGLKTDHIDIGSNATLSAILKEVQTKAKQENKRLQKDLQRTISGNTTLESLVSKIDNNTANIENSLFNFERDYKNKCFSSYIQSNFKSTERFKDMLQDPNISKKYNDQGDQSFKNSIVKIMNHKLFTLEEKIKQIKKLETKNNRFTLQTGASQDFDNLEIGASERIKASQMLGIFADNCKQRYSSLQDEQTGESPQEMARAVKTYASKRKQLQKSFLSQLRSNIITEMENCPSQSNVGKGENSCEAGMLDPAGKNFCLRTANKCASNTLACHSKAEKIVDRTRKEQKKISDRYQANVDNLKKKMASQFNLAQKAMEAQSRQLDGIYQMGSIYEVPLNLEFNTLTNKFLKDTTSFDPTLMMEDPQQYLTDIKADIKKTIAQVEKSNDAIMNGTGSKIESPGVIGEMRKYQANYKKMKTEVWDVAIKNCESLIGKYNSDGLKAQAEQQKAMAKRNKDVGVACAQLTAFEENPVGFCEPGKLKDLGDQVAVVTTAIDARSLANINGFSRVCNVYGSKSDNEHDATLPEEKVVDKEGIVTFCKNNTDYSACDTLKAAVGNNINNIDQLCMGNTKKVDLTADSDAVRLFIEENKIGETFTCQPDGSTELFPFNYGDINLKNIECTDNTKTVMDTKKFLVDNLSNRSAVIEFYEKETKNKKYSGDNSCEPKYNVNSNRTLKFAYLSVEEQITRKQVTDHLSQLGGVPIAACNATQGNGVGKGFLPQQMGQQRGLANQGALGFTL